MTAARSLSELARQQQPSARWHICTVSTVNGDGTVGLTYLDAVIDEVTCLNGFVPSVGDLALVLASNEIGWIVLGRVPQRS